MEDLIIIGSGPAGYTAAIYGARAGFNPVIISGLLPGGQLTNTTEVDNWPGDADNLMGPDLMERMKIHCQKLNCQLVSDNINKVSFSNSPLKLYGENTEYLAKTVILACGASPLMLGLEDENKYLGRGISSCATCDGFFFKGKQLAVVGGGNTAVEDAIFLSNIAARVKLIHRRDKLRADKVLQDRLFALEQTGKIEIIWNTELISYLGDEKGISGAIIRNTRDAKELSIKIDGIFIAIGHRPNSDFLANEVELNNGYVKINGVFGPGFTTTSLARVFAAGDIVDYNYRQAITSAAMGCMAALDVRNFLSAGE